MNGRIPGILKQAMIVLAAVFAGWVAVALFAAFSSADGMRVFPSVRNAVGFIELLVVSLACLAVGWFTNWAALFLLFRPRKLYFCQIGFLKEFGVFPRQKENIAVAVADLIHTRLLTKERLTEYLSSRENAANLEVTLRNIVKKVLEPSEPYPTLRRLLAEHMGLTHEVYQRCDEFIETAVGFIGAWLSEPERRGDIEKALVTLLCRFRGRTLQDLVGAEGVGEIRRMGDVLVDELLEGLEPFLLRLLALIPRDRTVREALGDSVVEALADVIDKAVPDLLREFSELLQDQEIRDEIFNAVMAAAEKLLERLMSGDDGFWSQVKAWTAKKVFGNPSEILDRAGMREKLRAFIFEQLAKTKESLASESWRRRASQKLRAFFLRFVDMRVSDFLISQKAQAEIVKAIASSCKTPAVREAVCSLWHRVLEIQAQATLDRFLPAESPSLIGARNLVERMKDAMDPHASLREARSSLHGALHRVCKDSNLPARFAGSLHFLQRLLIDESLTVVVICDLESWRQWVTANLPGMPENVISVEHVPGKETIDVQPWIGNGVSRAALEASGCCESLRGFGLRTTFICWPGKPAEVPADLMSACEILIECGNLSARPWIFEDKDAFGAFRHATVGSLAQIETLLAERVVGWDRRNELTRICGRLMNLMEVADCPSTPSWTWLESRLTALDDLADKGLRQVTQEILPYVFVGLSLARNSGLPDVPPRAEGLVSRLMELIGTFLKSGDSRILVASAFRDLVNRFLDLEIGRPVERLGPAPIHWCEKNIPNWLVRIFQQNVPAIAEQINFKPIIERTIREADLTEIEQNVRDKLAGPAFLWLEVLGGILGFLTGALLHFAMPASTALILKILG